MSLESSYHGCSCNNLPQILDMEKAERLRYALKKSQNTEGTNCTEKMGYFHSQHTETIKYLEILDWVFMNYSG